MHRSQATAVSALGLVLVLILSACQARPPSPDIGLSDLNGGTQRLSTLRGRPAILVFWRSDCGPCLIELEGLRGLETASRPAHLVTVALQDRASAAAYLGRAGLRPAQAWVATTPAEQVLVDFNGPPPRLPLAVALDAQGRVCQRHVGLLGATRVKQWVSECS